MALDHQCDDCRKEADVCLCQNHYNERIQDAEREARDRATMNDE